MAVSHRETGSWATYTADGTVAIPASAASGDRMFVFAAWKDFSVTATIADWTEVTEYADGTVAQGNGTGSMKVGCWYKDHDGSESNPTLDFSAAPNIGAAVMVVMQKGSGETWGTPSFATAPHTWGTSSTTTSATSGTVDVPDSGVVMCIVSQRDDGAVTFTRGTNGVDVASGITWNGNYVENPATHFSTTTNNDMAADVGYRLVTTGAAGATLRATGTLGAAETGSILWVVQGATTLVTPTTASLTTSRFAPTVTTTNNQSVTPGTASLTTSRFAPTVTATDHKSVTPGTASLTTATFAPTVTVGAGGVTVTPGTASLTTTRFAPTVSVSDHKLVTPGTASLSTATFVPTVTATSNVVITPGVAGLTLTTFAPTVTGDPVVVEAAQGPTPAGSRRRYILPDGRQLIATRREVEELLERFVTTEIKSQKKKQKKQAKVLEAVGLIEIEPQIIEVKLPSRYVFKPDPKTYEEAIKAIQRRLDDEEAILLLI
jgi:hypothetical protein